jgi:mono/diheme cytochrome c family protein
MIGNTRVWWGFGLLLAAGGTIGAGQTTAPRTTPLVSDSVYGPDLYRLYCATCHGQDGTGGGPRRHGTQDTAIRSHRARAASYRRVSGRGTWRRSFPAARP